MGRFKVAPHDFDCQYKKSCPHLGGASTKWVYHCYQEDSRWSERYEYMYSSLKDENQELFEENELLKRKLSQVEAKLQTLHRSQFKKNIIKKSPAGKIKKRKHGAKKGHPGYTRQKPKRIDNIVKVDAPGECPYCNNKSLKPVEEISEHIQEDIILVPKAMVTNYIHKQAYCSKCGCNVSGKGENEILGSYIGPVAKATAIYLRYKMNLPYRKVQTLFNDLYGLKFTASSAMGFDRTATKKGMPIYDDLLEKIKKIPVAYADETSWRQDGINHQLWYTGNRSMAVFHINRHRSSEVAQYLLGENFNGGLVTDGFAAYNSVNAKVHQSCCSHLIRNAKDKKKVFLSYCEKAEITDNRIEKFYDKIAKFFSNVCKLNKEKEQKSLTDKEVLIIKKKLTKQINIICKENLNHKEADTFRLRLLKLNDEDKLFAFLSIPEMDPTNNHSEQTIRFMVIFRKIMFGTRSPEGSISHSVLPSLIYTAQRQGIHPREFIETLFTSNIEKTQKKLFGNST